MLQVPELLKCPPKLYPVITEFNNYLYFLLEGGRGSGKTETVARDILYIGEKRKVKICCGREIQKSIENSVKSVFDKIVSKRNLNWKISDKELVHRKTSSRIFFQGFREQGYPLAQASDFLLSSDKIEYAQNITFNQEEHPENKVMAVDLAASGGDLCVAKLLEQKSMTGWEETQTITWAEPDTDVTKGKIINLYGIWKPDILIIDADGLGYPIYVTVKKSIDNAIGFRGAGSPKNLACGNARADGYMAVKEFIDNGWLKLRCENTSRQLEYIKRDFKPNGLTFIQNKKDIRKEQAESPDFADTLMMAIYAITYHSYLFAAKMQKSSNSFINNDFNPYE